MNAKLKHPGSYASYRISPDDTNRLALIFDPVGESTPFVACIEIFDVGGSTPPNRHMKAHEMFFVLHGHGLARSGDAVLELRTGDSLLVAPGCWHRIENLGPGRFYTLTLMVPDEDFAALIRRGTPAPLDEEDLRVLQENNISILNSANSCI